MVGDADADDGRRAVGALHQRPLVLVGVAAVVRRGHAAIVSWSWVGRCGTRRSVVSRGVGRSVLRRVERSQRVHHDLVGRRDVDRWRPAGSDPAPLPRGCSGRSRMLSGSPMTTNSYGASIGRPSTISSPGVPVIAVETPTRTPSICIVSAPAPRSSWIASRTSLTRTASSGSRMVITRPGPWAAMVPLRMPIASARARASSSAVADWLSELVRSWSALRWSAIWSRSRSSRALRSSRIRTRSSSRAPAYSWSSPTARTCTAKAKPSSSVRTPISAAASGSRRPRRPCRAGSGSTGLVRRPAAPVPGSRGRLLRRLAVPARPPPVPVGRRLGRGPPAAGPAGAAPRASSAGSGPCPGRWSPVMRGTRAGGWPRRCRRCGCRGRPRPPSRAGRRRRAGRPGRRSAPRRRRWTRRR